MLSDALKPKRMSSMPSNAKSLKYSTPGSLGNDPSPMSLGTISVFDDCACC